LNMTHLGVVLNLRAKAWEVNQNDIKKITVHSGEMLEQILEL
jgi:hypothetical protein